MSAVPEDLTLTWRRILSRDKAPTRSGLQTVAVAASLLLFVLAWTIHGAIVEGDKSLHYDLLEAYAWGHEFQLGYHQHGPFWAWIAGVWFMVFPTTNAAFVLLEAVNAAAGLLGAWFLTGLFANGRTRNAATLLLLATPFYTILAFKYNANTIFISLWPWTLYFFVKSLDEMRPPYALCFGMLVAACILSKYYAIVLLVTCAFSIVFHPNGARYVFSRLPWIAGAVFAVLVLPHVLWSLRSGAPPVAYAMGLTGKGWGYSLRHAARFLFEIALYQSVVAGIIAVVWRFSKRRTVIEFPDPLPAWRRRFLAALVLAPPALTVLFGLCFQLKVLPIMAVGVFPLMPLFLMQFATPFDERRMFRAAAAVAASVTLLAIVAAPIQAAIMLRRDSASVDEPRRELAERVTALWRAEIHTPLRYIGAEDHYANAVSFYSDDHPSSFPGLTYAKALWVTPEKLKQAGLLIACVHEDAECLRAAEGFRSGSWKRNTIKLARMIGRRQVPEITFDIFIIPPQAS